MLRKKAHLRTWVERRRKGKGAERMVGQKQRWQRSHEHQTEMCGSELYKYLCSKDPHKGQAWPEERESHYRYLHFLTLKGNHCEVCSVI